MIEPKRRRCSALEADMEATLVYLMMKCTKLSRHGRSVSVHTQDAREPPPRPPRPDVYLPACVKQHLISRGLHYKQASSNKQKGKGKQASKLASTLATGTAKRKMSSYELENSSLPRSLALRICSGSTDAYNFAHTCKGRQAGGIHE